MVRTSSTMLPLGSLMPFFDLAVIKPKEEIGGRFSTSLDRINSNMLNDQAVLFMVLCAHCPFVKHLESALALLADDFGSDVQLLAIASNCLETHPQDGPEYLAKQIIANRWNFPYLLDFEQTLAKSLMAACTPDFFLFSSAVNGEHNLIYRGQFDESRPGNDINPTGSDLRSALDECLSFRKISIDQKPSIGCNIKWRPGSEPSWFV